jgi:hypothetical protein
VQIGELLDIAEKKVKTKLLGHSLSFIKERVSVIDAHVSTPMHGKSGPV